jgi:PhnB protein
MGEKYHPLPWDKLTYSEDHGANVYAHAFGANEQFRLTEPNGRIGHAEVKIGSTTIMLSYEYPERGIQGPRALGGTTYAMHLHVDDVDTSFARAASTGATVIQPLKDQFYGERSGMVRDPFGREWLLGS